MASQFSWTPSRCFSAPTQVLMRSPRLRRARRMKSAMSAMMGCPTSRCWDQRSQRTAAREASSAVRGRRSKNSWRGLLSPKSQRLSKSQQRVRSSIYKDGVERWGSIIQQMNQRASHFQLGSTSQNYRSVYNKDYTEKEASQQAPAPSAHRAASQPPQKGSFETTNRALLRPWQHPEVNTLDDQKLKELRSHHFRLGTYAPKEALTTHQTFHDLKPITGEASKNQEESKNRMRGHNHNFKEQDFTNYRSAYAKQFTPKEGQAQQPTTAPKEERPICFGSQPLPMLTTSALSYTPKQAPRQIVRPEPALGVSLGDKGEPMQTMNQLYYDQKEYSKVGLPESTMKELRGTHFNLGQAQTHYATENNNYRSMGKSLDNRLNFKVPIYQSGTWADKQARFNATTTNQRELPPRPVEPFQRAAQTHNAGIEFGGHAGQYTTEFKGRFATPSPVTNTVEVNKNSNVVIGVGTTNYQTENKASYQPKDLLEGRSNVDIKKLSSEDHFRIGGTAKDTKITVYQDEHRKDIDNRNRLFHKENK